LMTQEGESKSPLLHLTVPSPHPTGEETAEVHNPLNPDGLYDEIQVGDFKIQLDLSSQFVEQVLSANQENRLKMAGLAAAQAIKNHSQLASSPAADPYSVWSELRSIILKRLDLPESGMAA
jgi:hypothetical protein